MGIELQELRRRDFLSGVTRLQAITIGHRADVDAASVGAVHSVFARSVNLQIDEDLWTLVASNSADLPFGIRIALDDFEVFGLCRGDRVSVRAGHVAIDSERARIVVDCRAAPRWRHVPRCRLEPGLDHRLAIVGDAAWPKAWAGSGAMARAVTSALAGPPVLAETIGSVVGNGPGLTPAGDDVLAGILAVLTSPAAGLGGAAAAASLRELIPPLLPRTGDVSAQLLRQALNGVFCRPLHDLVDAVAGGAAADEVEDAVCRVIAIGATSGADACVGLITSASVYFRRQEGLA